MADRQWADGLAKTCVSQSMYIVIGSAGRVLVTSRASASKLEARAIPAWYSSTPKNKYAQCVLMMSHHVGRM